jgi:hypothetical protein
VPEPRVQQQQFNLNNSGQGTRQQVGGVKRYFSNFNEPPLFEKILTKNEFTNLPSRFKKGGHEHTRGRGGDYVCSMCFKLGHTFEYCVAHNGYVQNGPPVLSFGLIGKRYGSKNGGPLLLTDGENTE